MLSRVFELSSDGYHDYRLVADHDRLVLDCIEDDGNYARIRWQGVLAYKFFGEPYAPDCPEGSYNAVAVDEKSQWMSSLTSLGSLQRSQLATRRHYVASIADIGLFECIAEDCTVEMGSD